MDGCQATFPQVENASTTDHVSPATRSRNGRFSQIRRRKLSSQLQRITENKTKRQQLPKALLFQIISSHSLFEFVECIVASGSQLCLYLLVIEVRPPAFNICSCVKPVLKCCSRTDWNTTDGYTELKGLLGIKHTGSESELDISMLTTRETGRVKEFGRDGYETENKNYNEPARVVSHALLGNGNSQRAGHGHISAEMSGNSSLKMKFLCSFGGKILPRPSDGKLRYVGGDTRIIQLRKNISWQELRQKTSSIYNEAHMIKYQLPREELDSLVSVSCDEDLHNMMEEYSVLEGGEESNKLRLFLFSTSELEDSHYDLGRIEGDSEVQYVVAVNGMDMAAHGSLGGHGIASKSATDMGRLFDLNVRGESGVGRVRTHSDETRAAPSVGIVVPSSMQKQEKHLNDPGLVSQESIAEPTEPPHEKAPATKDILMQIKKHKKLADATAQGDLEFAGFSRDVHLLQCNENILKPYMNNLGETSTDADRSKSKDPPKEPLVGEAKTVGMEHPSSVPGTPLTLQDSPASNLPENQGEMGVNINNVMGHVPPFAWAESSAGAVYREESSFHDSSPKKGDIIIDINDRFPPDLLLDMFNNARSRDGATGTSPLCKDEAGMSSNMQNNEPRRWSFVQNFAQDESARKGYSLMDQDCIVLSSPLTRIEERAPETNDVSPLNGKGFVMVDVESQIAIHKGIPQMFSFGADVTGLCKDYIHSQTIPTNLHEKRDEVVHAEDTPTKLGEYPSPVSEEGDLEVGHINGPVVPSTGAFDICDLQIIMNDDLEELRELGSGSFGTVYYGKWRGTDVAIKRIKKSCFTGRSSQQEKLTVEFWREAEILSNLHHPNVVAFYGVVQDGPGGTLATVTEFMVNGSLRQVLLHKDKFIDRRKRLIIAMDAAFGMEYLHSKNIVHFDLKCDNLLVNMRDPSRPICKVGDFGLSKIKRNTLVSGGVRGTLPWMAPELLNGHSSKVSEKVDVFSFGIVMWEILTGEEPYANMHYGAIIGGIVNNTLRPPVPGWCDPGWRKLMEQCWAPDPVARPSFTEIASRLRQMFSASQTRAPAR
ncbi:hypothetical protein AAC387_Pa06g1822 [Persea americana]